MESQCSASSAAYPLETPPTVINIAIDNARELAIQLDDDYVKLPKPLIWIYIDAVTKIKRTERLLLFYADIVCTVQDLLTGNVRPACFSTMAGECLEISINEVKTMFAEFFCKAIENVAILEAFTDVVNRLYKRFDYKTAKRTTEDMEHFKDNIDAIKPMYVELLSEARCRSKEEKQKALLELNEKCQQLGHLPYQINWLIEKLMRTKPKLNIQYLHSLETPEDVAYEEVIQPAKLDFYKKYVYMIRWLGTNCINDASFADMRTLRKNFEVLDENLIGHTLAAWHPFLKNYTDLRAAYEFGRFLLHDNSNLIYRDYLKELPTSVRTLLQPLLERCDQYLPHHPVEEEVLQDFAREFKHDMGTQIALDLNGWKNGRVLSTYWDEHFKYPFECKCC